MKRILIVGATSAIAEATAREFARRGDALFLVARSLGHLQTVADDLKLRGTAQIGIFTLDALDFPQHVAMLEAAIQSLGAIDIALVAHGSLSDQAACEGSVDLLRHELDVNAVSVMALCTLLANYLTEQHSGTLAVISSVAGDRGRQSNYAYGAAKAAVTAFTSGLRQRLHKRGVRVLTIKPGFVDTPMTAAFPKGMLWAQPADVARAIVRAIDTGRPVLYTPWFWRPILWVVRALPESIFQRLST